MYRIVAVGEKDLILAFRGAGADLETDTSEAELEEVLTKLSKDRSVALVLVTESIAAEGMEVIRNFRIRTSAFDSIGIVVYFAVLHINKFFVSGVDTDVCATGVLERDVFYVILVSTSKHISAA